MFLFYVNQVREQQLQRMLWLRVLHIVLCVLFRAYYDVLLKPLIDLTAFTISSGLNTIVVQTAESDVDVVQVKALGANSPEVQES